jgi:hypothetical protein
MSYFVKVEYEIRDVIVDDPKKRKSRPKSAGISRSSPPRNTNDKPVNSPQIKSGDLMRPKIESLSNHFITPVATAIEEFQKPKLEKKPTSAGSGLPGRLRSGGRQRKAEASWQFSTVGIDRDMTLLDQDLKISSFRMNHPSIYEEYNQEKRFSSPSAAGVEGESTERNHHHSKSTKSVCHRNRLDSKTCGNIKNNSLPFHPHLKDTVDHGIHGQRWNIMTIPEDDPERLKPALHTQTKSHDDFSNSFNSCKFQTGRSHTVQIMKPNLLS